MIKYLNKFKDGDIAIAKRFIRFCDGTTHNLGQKIKVTNSNKLYFNICNEDYDKEVINEIHNPAEC